MLERALEYFLAPPGVKEDRKRISELKTNFRRSIEALLNGWGSISFNANVDWASYPLTWTSAKNFPSAVEVRASKRRFPSQYSIGIAEASSQLPPILAFRLQRNTFTVLINNRPVTIVKSCFPVDELEAEIDDLERTLRVVQLVTEARRNPI